LTSFASCQRCCQPAFPNGSIAQTIDPLHSLPTMHASERDRKTSRVADTCRLATGGRLMEEAVEWFVAISALAVGASHIARPRDWTETFHQLHRCGRPGAFANGGLSLIPGAIIVAGHGSWTWPGAVLTGFGWLLVVKGMICLVAPDKALQSMARGAQSP